jgi:hypothetical protein
MENLDKQLNLFSAGFCKDFVQFIKHCKLLELENCMKHLHDSPEFIKESCSIEMIRQSFIRTIDFPNMQKILNS